MERKQAAKNSFLKDALHSYKEHLGYCMMVSIGLVAVILLVVALGLIDPIIYLVAIPFILYPALFAFQMSITRMMVEKNAVPSLKEDLTMYRTYFNWRFNGSYRFFGGLWRMILVTLVFSMLAAFLVTLLPIYEGMGEFYSNLIEVYNSGDADAAYELLSSNPEVTTITSVISLIGSGAAFVFFVMWTAYNSFSLFLCQVIPNNSFKWLTSRFYVRYRKNYLSDFLSINWMLPILVLIGYAAGAAIGYFLLSDYPEYSYIIPLVGYAAGGIGIGLYFPIFAIGQIYLNEVYFTSMMRLSADEMEASFERFLANNPYDQHIDEATKAKWKEDFDNMRKQADKMDEAKKSKDGEGSAE